MTWIYYLFICTSSLKLWIKFSSFNATQLTFQAKHVCFCRGCNCVKKCLILSEVCFLCCRVYNYCFSKLMYLFKRCKLDHKLISCVFVVVLTLIISHKTHKKSYNKTPWTWLELLWKKLVHAAVMVNNLKKAGCFIICKLIMFSSRQTCNSWLYWCYSKNAAKPNICIFCIRIKSDSIKWMNIQIYMYQYFWPNLNSKGNVFISFGRITLSVLR